MASIDNMAKLNSIHYLVDKHGTGQKGVKKINKKLDGTGYTLDKLKRGVASFKGDGHTVVTVKGTDISNKQDILSDIKLGLGFSKHDKQFKDRQKMIKNIYKETDGDKYLTGHSLGGSVVSATLAKSKSIRDNTTKAAAFNSGYTKAFHDEINKGLTKEDNKDINKVLEQHHVKGDIISTGLTSKRVGVLKKYSAGGSNPIVKHGLDNFINEDQGGEEL